MDDLLPFEIYQQAPGVLPGQDNLLSWKNESDTNVLRQAVTKNPDESANVSRMSKELGRERSAVEADPVAAKADIRTKQIVNETEDLPVTRRVLNDPVVASVAHDSVEQLGNIERIARAFNRGAATREAGIAGFDQLRVQSPATVEATRKAKERLAGLGHDEYDNGFWGYLSSASETLGQMASSFADPQLAVRMAALGATGAAVGMTGGPAAPVTAPVGAAMGMAVGATSHFVQDSFEVEAGGAYTDMIDDGIEADIARPLALGVGVVNASLEVASMAVIVNPFVQGAKALAKAAVGKAVRTPAVLEAARQFATAYAGGIASETVTEGMQEVVQIFAAEWGKNLSSLDIANITEEEMIDRVGGVMIQTFKAMVVLAAPGPGVRWATEQRAAATATKDMENLDELKKAYEASAVTERDIEAASTHLTQAMEENGVNQVYISSDAFLQWLGEFEEPSKLADALGVSDQLTEAEELGSDIRVDANKFAKYLIRDQGYDALKEHIKLDAEGLTPFEANERGETGLDELVAEVEDTLLTTTQDAATSLGVKEKKTEVETDDTPEEAALKNVAAELGLRAMFKTAEEAGMTPKQYEGYLRKLDEAAQMARKRMEDAPLKEALRVIDKEYIDAVQKIREEVLESQGNLPVYQAIHNLEFNHLDGEAVKKIVSGNADLKAAAGRLDKYTTPKDKEQTGIDPELYAQLIGYDDAETMFLDMLTSPTYKQAVETVTAERIKTELAGQSAERERLIAARKALLNDPILDTLTAELNAMKRNLTEDMPAGSKRKTKNISAKQLKQDARRRLSGMKIRDIDVNKFLHQAAKYGTRAARSLKQRTEGASKAAGTKGEKKTGDRQLAVQNKYLQVLNYTMALEATAINERVEKQRVYLKKFTGKQPKVGKLPLRSLEAIREILEKVRFSGPVMFREKENKNLAAIAHDAQDPIAVPATYLDKEGRVSYELISLDEFSSMYDLVREIEKKGNADNKLRDLDNKYTLQENVNKLIDKVRYNLAQRKTNVDDLRGKIAKLNDSTHEYFMLLTNQDTQVRELDGWEDLGLAYELLKRPYDRAMANGYLPGKRGLLTRQVEISKGINDLYKGFTKKERLHMSDPIKIPGISRTMSHQTVLVVLLNSGNKGNYDAMTANSFTEDEVQAIQDYASKKDWEFAKKTWDYLESFWDEIVENEVRRRNVRPKKVEGWEIATKHGPIQGGYYPIQFDSGGSVIDGANSVDMLIEQLRYGRFLSSQTAHGHTIARTGGGKNPISQDLFVINQHLNSIIYDLEMGDAVTDIYKVLNHKDFKEALVSQGQKHRWDAMNLWLRDVVTAEIGLNTSFERGLRWMRAGITIGALAWKFSTGLLQLLGTLQTAAALGKRNTASALFSVLRHPVAISKNINELSVFMQHRSDTWNKEIIDAKKQLSFTLLDKYTPGNTAHYIRESFFFMIKKLQRFTDLVTWAAAQRQGLEKFEGDVDKAIEYADRMVVRTQSSGIFGDRSAPERGSIHPKLQQTELFRTFTALMSYFVTKNNLAYEKTKNLDWRNPAKVTNYVADMTLLYVVEGMLALLIKGQWPDDDDDDSLLYLASTTAITTAGAGMVGIREFISEAQGFSGGGAIGNTARAFGEAWGQVSQKEIDRALITSVNKIAGIALHYPTSQPNTTIRGFEDIDEEDSTWDAFVKLMMGPKFK